MDSEQWSQVETVFHELADRPVEVQTAALAELPDSVAAAVRAMLTADASGDTILDRPIGSAAQQLLQEPGALPHAPFGPYRVQRLLGEGGMGVVYLAHRDDLNAPAAIKLLRDAWLSPTRRDRFRQEQRTLAALEHPGIARLLDADHLSDGTPWFAMEYVDGEPITDFCWRTRPSVRERLALIIAAAEAVRYAHAHAVIHRDLKPSNLLVTPDGRIKLLDFGIAKRTEGVVSDPTRTGLRLLTPAYAAPEQLAGETVGVQADVYAIGVMLFELLAGARPFDLAELSTTHAARTLRESPPPRLSLAVRRATGDARARRVDAANLSRAEWADLDALVAGALHADVDARYRSVEALIQDLQRFLASEPLAMQPATLAYRARLFVRRRRHAVAAAAAAGLVIMAGVVSYTRGITAARDAALAESARNARLQSFLVDLFQGGDAIAGVADSLRVVTLLDNGVREARALSNDRVAQVDLYQTLGSMALQLGRFPLADTLLREVVLARRDIDGAAHVESFRARLLYAQLLARRGDYDVARHVADSIYRDAVTLLPEADPTRLKVAERLGNALADVGMPDSALSILQAAITRYQRVDSTSVEFSDALTALANAHHQAEQYTTADSLNRRVLAIVRSHLGDTHPSLAYNYVNLGASANQQERYADAVAHYERAISINEAWYGPDNYRVAEVLRQLAQTWINQGKSAEALPVLHRVVRVLEASHDSTSPRLANALGSLAFALADSGDARQAEALHHRALRIARAQLGNDHPSTMIHQTNYAVALTKRGMLSDAEELLTDLVERGSRTLGAEHGLVMVRRVFLARVHVAQRRYADALQHYAEAMPILERDGVVPAARLAAIREEYANAHRALGNDDAARAVLAITGPGARTVR